MDANKKGMIPYTGRLSANTRRLDHNIVKDVDYTPWLEHYTCRMKGYTCRMDHNIRRMKHNKSRMRLYTRRMKHNTRRMRLYTRRMKHNTRRMKHNFNRGNAKFVKDFIKTALKCPV